MFLEVWDPLRVSDEPYTRNEYDRYLDGVLKLLVSGASDRDILAHLDEIVGRMGMDGSRVSLNTVVAALREIDLACKVIPKAPS